MAAPLPRPEQIARGPGPGWFRVLLVVVAGLYYMLLVKHPAAVGMKRPIAFFSECTCLFPNANMFAIEYKLEAWSCADQQWHPLDPRPYFPIEADDKESRFQRLGHFYQTTRPVMHALEDFVLTRHASVDDAVTGPIGGIRLFVLDVPFPAPGEPVARYAYHPLEIEPQATRRDLYYTKESTRREHCGGAR